MIYVASKTKHAPMWRALRAAGLPINSTWIDEAEVGQTKSYQDLWMRCIKEASEARVLIAYAEGDEVLKGVFVEIGAALASGKQVFTVGLPDTLSFTNHPLVDTFHSIDRAMKHATKLLHGE